MNVVWIRFVTLNFIWFVTKKTNGFESDTPKNLSKQSIKLPGLVRLSMLLYNSNTVS